VNGQRSVLIVDRTGETREVLATALERRGVRTLWAGKARTGAELAGKTGPTLSFSTSTGTNCPRTSFPINPESSY